MKLAGAKEIMRGTKAQSAGGSVSLSATDILIAVCLKAVNIVTVLYVFDLLRNWLQGSPTQPVVLTVYVMIFLGCTLEAIAVVILGIYRLLRGWH